jgi:hypothetical protein
MRRKTDPDLQLPPNGDAEMQEEVDQLRAELERAQERYRQLQDELDQGVHIEDEVPVGSDAERGIGMYPVIIAGLVAGWMGIYMALENREGLDNLRMGASVVFGGAAVAVIWKWVQVGWSERQWLMIPNFELVLLALLASAQIFSGGMIWDGTVESPDGHPVRAIMVILSALIFAATSYCERGILLLIDFLNHPVLIARRIFHDKRRKGSTGPESRPR